MCFNPCCRLIILCLCLCAAGCNPLGNVIHVGVTSDTGSPIDNASVTFRWSTNEPWGPSLRSGDPHAERVATDSGGSASARIREDHYVGIDVAHEMYYASFVGVVDAALSQHTTSATAIPISLTRIISPRPLIAKHAYVILPNLAGSAAYDFVVGDLVFPYGKGLVADAKLTWTRPPSGSKIEACSAARMVDRIGP